MKEYTKKIREYIETVSENMLIEANALHNKEFPEIPESTYYKILERLCKDQRLIHLTNGLYYKPKESAFGQIPISDKEIAAHYIHNGHGIIIGYHLYNDKGITTQISKNIEVLSNVIGSQKKTAGNVKIKRANIKFTSKNIPIIETLEILQNYNKIQDINKKGLLSYMAGFADKYSDNAAIEVLQNMKYKKSTISFVKSFLDYLNVPNSLGKYLSKLSNYAIPNMERLYEIN